MSRLKIPGNSALSDLSLGWLSDTCKGLQWPPTWDQRGEMLNINCFDSEFWNKKHGKMVQFPSSGFNPFENYARQIRSWGTPSWNKLEISQTKYKTKFLGHFEKTTSNKHCPITLNFVNPSSFQKISKRSPVVSQELVEGNVPRNCFPTKYDADFELTLT